ncbi:hypothetical protein Ddc_00113 [Ditylenchus destructor]|nr:hypothetical protein Ddc_00113 [Ditylenchus destructor]
MAKFLWRKIQNIDIFQAILILVAIFEFSLHVAASFHFVGYVYDTQLTDVTAVNVQQMRLADFGSIFPLLLFVGVIYKKKTLFVPYAVYKIIFVTVIAVNSVILVTANEYGEYSKFWVLGFVLLMAMQIGIIYTAFRFIRRIKKNGQTYSINIVNSINSNSRGGMRNKDNSNLFL